MIQYPDLGGDLALLEGRAEMLANEHDLVFLRPDARGHAPVLIGVGLILRRDCVDRYALGLVAL